MATNGLPLYSGLTGAAPEWDGYLLISVQPSAGVTTSNNVAVGPGSNVGYNTVGYNVWNTPTTAPVLIAGGSVSNVNYGVWVNDYDGYQSPGSSTMAVITNLNVSGASVAGVYVQDDPRASANGVVVQATVTGNTVLTNCGVGVLVQGNHALAVVTNNLASITGNGIGVDVDTGVALLQNNDLTGNTVAGIWATNGAIVDAGDCGDGNVTGLGSSSGGNDLSGYFAGPGVAIINGNAACQPSAGAGG